jgi:ribosomal protein L24
MSVRRSNRDTQILVVHIVYGKERGHTTAAMKILRKKSRVVVERGWGHK